jgi:hypothetical protein
VKIECSVSQNKSQAVIGIGEDPGIRRPIFYFDEGMLLIVNRLRMSEYEIGDEVCLKLT